MATPKHRSNLIQYYYNNNIYIYTTNKSDVCFILLYIAIRDPQIALKNHCEARSLETLAFVSKLRLMEPTRAERKNPWKKTHESCRANGDLPNKKT